MPGQRRGKAASSGCLFFTSPRVDQHPRCRGTCTIGRHAFAPSRDWGQYLKYVAVHAACYAIGGTAARACHTSTLSSRFLGRSQSGMTRVSRQVEEARAVVWLVDVAQLVSDDIVDGVHGGLDDPPRRAPRAARQSRPQRYAQRPDDPSGKQRSLAPSLHTRRHREVPPRPPLRSACPVV